MEQTPEQEPSENQAVEHLEEVEAAPTPEQPRPHE